MPTSSELFELFESLQCGAGWAALAGFEGLRVRVRAYADGREWSACMLIDGYEMEITGRGDDKGALGWTSETWIGANDTAEILAAAAMVTAEDLQAQSELTWSGIAA